MKRMTTALLAGLALTVSAGAMAQGQSNYEQFSECVAVTSWLMQGKDTKTIENKKRVQIPDGWKVVGTNIVKDKVPIFFICR
ncbi:MAG: hypothetical protein OEU50_18275 [Gammaproteobacteria bacterium]|nr:hypothetical protein [Gammaproteobacteria bacterium]